MGSSRRQFVAIVLTPVHPPPPSVRLLLGMVPGTAPLPPPPSPQAPHQQPGFGYAFAYAPGTPVDDSAAAVAAAAAAAAVAAGAAAAEPVAEAAAAAAEKLRQIPAGARLLLAEDCLSLLVVLLTELPRPAGRASARGSLRREVVHRLASSECTHSEVAAVTANLMEVR